jgi:probable HAF family extracellular repeat protein
MSVSSAVSTQVLPHERIVETIDIGPGTPVGINANNNVALVYRYRSYFWRQWGGLTDLGGFDPEYPQTRAFALNDRDTVVGSVLNAHGFFHPFIWTPMTGLMDADPVEDAEWAAWAVNNSGDIVGGYGIWPGPAGSASRRTADGVITTIRPLGANGGAAYDINMFGIAVGEAAFDDETQHSRPFLWNGDSVRDLGTLGGNDGAARRINSLNQVVGFSTTPTGDRHAFLWTDPTGMTDLGTLGGSWSFANAINEMGHVVGSAADGTGQARAFLWSPATGMVDLGPGTAVAVNEFDHVVGSSGGAGDMRAFLWTPADGRIELASDARAVDLNNNGYVVGAITASGGERTVIWRTAITDADWMTYRYGLIDAHVAYGSLKAGPAHALRALLANAERATRRGDPAAAQRALDKWATSFERWKAPGELPWQ